MKYHKKKFKFKMNSRSIKREAKVYSKNQKGLATTYRENRIWI
jgi:hypothetical protein